MTGERMSAAEFKVLREQLGLPASWVATQVLVTERSVSRWESGEDPVNHRAATLLRDLQKLTDKQIDQKLRQIERRNPDVAELHTYRRDRDWERIAPTRFAYLPASWHRAMTARLAFLIDRPVVINYAA